jgi:hypothetical protein
MDLTVTPTETPPKALGVMAHTASSNLKIEPHHMRNSLQVNKFPLAIPADKHKKEIHRKSEGNRVSRKLPSVGAIGNHKIPRIPDTL